MSLTGQDTHPAIVSVSDSLSLGLPLPICREPWPAQEGRATPGQQSTNHVPCVAPNTFQMMLPV